MISLVFAMWDGPTNKEGPDRQGLDREGRDREGPGSRHAGERERGSRQPGSYSLDPPCLSGPSLPLKAHKKEINIKMI